MAFRILSTDANFDANVALDILRPAIMCHLDLIAGQVYATTHPRSVTVGGATWTTVGAFGFVQVSEAALDGAALRARVGLVGMPYESLTPAAEDALIGRPAKLYLCAFDAAWSNPGLSSWFDGYIEQASTRLEPQPNGDILVSYFLTIGDQSNPRRQVSNHHAAGNGETGDTAQLLLFTVSKVLRWPQT